MSDPRDEPKIKILLRAGIINDTFMETMGYPYNIWKYIPVPLSEVPMNVVEDFFSLSAKRARGIRFEMAHYVTDEIAEHYFGELCESKGRPTTPSSMHRICNSPAINSIISILREGDEKGAREMLLFFIQDGRTYESEIGKINRSIAKQLDAIHTMRIIEDYGS